MRKSLLKSIARIRAPFVTRFRAPRIHFLHISKNAGTILRATMRNANEQQDRYRFVLHSHKFRLEDVPEGEFCAFSIRDPIARFYSGFYSRKRQGLPRRLNRWSPEEEKAFAAFDHACELAEALSNRDDTVRMRAVWAMMSIFHVNNTHLDWIGKTWEPGQSKVIAILRQDSLRSDFLEMMQVLGEDSLGFPDEDRIVNKGSYEDCPPLTSLAKRNLEAWYHRDFVFLETVESKWIQDARVRLNKLVAQTMPTESGRGSACQQWQRSAISGPPVHSSALHQSGRHEPGG